MKANIPIGTMSICLVLTLCRCLSVAAEQGICERDWLFGKQIELYNYLLKGTEVANPLRENLQGGFHRFAFEYWLLCRAKPESASPWWRYQTRQMLHREAKNPRFFNDPAGLLPFFKGGKLVPSVVISPVAGLELTGLLESDYRALVKGFQTTFFDATNVFPVSSVPTASAIAGGQTEEHLELAEMMSHHTWLKMSRDKLPVRYQDNPFAAFQLLSVTGQAYYLPAFLFMCERESGLVSGLPEKLVAALAGESPKSVELRSKLTGEQKKSIAAFFEDWFGRGDTALLEMLRKQFGVQPDK